MLFLQLTDSTTFIVYWASIEHCHLLYFANPSPTENAADPLRGLGYLPGWVSLSPPLQVAESPRSPANCRSSWAWSPDAESGHLIARDWTAFSLGSCAYPTFCPYGRRRWHCSRNTFSGPFPFTASNFMDWSDHRIRCWPSWGFEHPRCQAPMVPPWRPADLLATQIGDTFLRTLGRFTMKYRPSKVKTAGQSWFHRSRCSAIFAPGQVGTFIIQHLTTFFAALHRRANSARRAPLQSSFYVSFQIV